MELITVIFRTLFFYFFVSLSYRLMGKREVGQLGIIDLIVSILIAELVAISIENSSDSLLLTIVPIAMLVLIEVVLAFLSLKSRKIRNILQGKPSIIICDGKINYHEMVKQRYTIDDLLINLRQNQIKSIEDVEYAFLESNGKLSVFKYDDTTNKKVYPLPIILDGELQNKTINKANLSSKKIYNLLLEYKLNIENIFYAFYKNDKLFVIEKNSQNTFLDNKNLKKRLQKC